MHIYSVNSFKESDYVYTYTYIAIVMHFPQEPTADSAVFVKQLSNSVLEKLHAKDDIITTLREEIATLKKQLQQRDKLLSDSQLNSSVSYHVLATSCIYVAIASIKLYMIT